MHGPILFHTNNIIYAYSQTMLMHETHETLVITASFRAMGGLKFP